MRSILSSRHLLLSITVSPALRQAARLRLLAAMVLLPGLGVLSPLMAATLPINFTETQVASGLSNPITMAFAPDGRLFICEQGGQIRIIKNGALVSTPFLTLTNIDSSNERGLLGIAFDPNFSTNHYVYINYTVAVTPAHNRISRFTAVGDLADTNSEAIIFELNDQRISAGLGGAINFGADGKLYTTVGTNEYHPPSNDAQVLTNFWGKMLRINSDGSIPSDNPFFNDVNVVGQNKAIWALGLRVPFTFAVQPGSGRMFINDVGEDTWEEIDEATAGANYGWPTCEGLCSPPNPSLRDPLFEYGHGATATTGCAITGGAFYNPTTTQFPNDYVGKYFFTDLCTGWIRRLDPVTKTATGFASGISFPVDLQVSNNGSLYYLTLGGSVYRVQYTPPTAAVGVIRGQITTGDGAPLSGAVVRLSGTQSRKTVTDRNGNYHFDNVETGGFYTLMPSRANYNFSPVQRSFTALGARHEAAFSGFRNGDAENPLDTPEYFVRQQYVDILGREPDEGGFNYWSDQIIACAGDVDCTRVRRMAVAAAFFIELEFRQSGAFIYNLYQGGLGRRPAYAEYSADRKQVVGGPTLDEQKQEFTAAFVARAEFAGKYESNTTAESFVNALLANVRASGIDLSRQRDILIRRYNEGASQTESRTLVLRDVTENAAVRDANYNAAFVLVEYFGYLHRNPDKNGYDFWLSVLNTGEPGNYRGMVCAFITSTEYQRRFSAIVSHSNSECGQ